MQPRILPQSARRLRDEPIDTAIAVCEQFGSRGATTLAEAQTAAYFDGRLRRAGLKVSADGFDAPFWPGWDGTVLAGCMSLGVIVYPWQPVLSLLLALFGCCAGLYGLWRNGAPVLVGRRASQNIIATRALAQKPRKRVVLLVPLDAPPRLPGALHVLYDGQRAIFIRFAASVVILLLALGGYASSDFALRLLCWYLQFVPCTLLLAAAGVDLWLRQRPASPGAINHAGALATVLACAEELVAAAHIELWVVALGASESGSGLRDLLRRYPFESARTQFVTLESIGSGELVYVTRVGLTQPIASDATLLALAAATDASDQQINASPRPLRHAPTTLGTLRQAGWQAIGIACLGADGRPALRASAADTIAALDAGVIERAVRLATGLVRAIDAA